MYEKYASVIFLLSAVGIIAQLLILPFLMSETNGSKSIIQERMKRLQILAKTAEIQLVELEGASERLKREVSTCISEPGPPGEPGVAGEDGEQGDDGLDGPPGMDAHQMMLTMQEKCVVCPAGPVGLPGPIGDRGITGQRGEKGIPGVPGLDGHEGDIGPQGPVGLNGTAGSPGKKGPDGIPAIGGVGEPGPKGLPGAIGGAGQQGMRGKKNYIYGPPGADGKPGIRGLDGLPGLPGLRGDKGLPGEPGSDIKLCPCPSEFRTMDSLDTEQISSADTVSTVVNAEKNIGKESVTESKSDKFEVGDKVHSRNEEGAVEVLDKQLLQQTVEGDVGMQKTENKEDESAHKIYVVSGKVNEPELKRTNIIADNHQKTAIVQILTQKQEEIEEDFDDSKRSKEIAGILKNPIKESFEHTPVSSLRKLDVQNSKSPIIAEYLGEVDHLDFPKISETIKSPFHLSEIIIPATSTAGPLFSNNQRRFIYVTKRPRTDHIYDNGI